MPIDPPSTSEVPGDATDRPRAAEFDAPRVERAVRELLVAIGEDPDREGLRDTPARVSRSYREMFAGLRMEPDDVLATTFDLGHDELVLVKDIEVFSQCEHHLVPFFGVAHVGYLPGERIVGLSKLARVVDLFARDLQLQERLTKQIAGWLDGELAPKGVGVVLEAEHLCMSLRGAHKSGTRTVTSALHGLVREDQRTRQEFLELTR